MARRYKLFEPVVLMSDKSNKFDRYISPYTQHIEPYLPLLHREFKRINNDVLQEAYVYLRWATRKLEYSYVLKQCSNYQKDGIKVLDVGCGFSPLLRYFSDLGYDAFGLDVDTEVLRIQTDQNSHLKDARINYLAQSGTNLGFQDGTFDIIVCVSVLEHLRRGENSRFMREMLRVLAPGGLLIVTVDFNGSRGSSQRITNILHRILNQLIILTASGMKNFNPNAMKQLLNEIGNFKSIASVGGPYSIEDVKKYLLTPISNLLGEEIGNYPGQHLKPLNVIQIKKFWESHEFERRSYLRARIYVPLGFTIKKLDKI